MYYFNFICVIRVNTCNLHGSCKLQTYEYILMMPSVFPLIVIRECISSKYWNVFNIIYNAYFKQLPLFWCLLQFIYASQLICSFYGVVQLNALHSVFLSFNFPPSIWNNKCDTFHTYVLILRKLQKSRDMNGPNISFYILFMFPRYLTLWHSCPFQFDLFQFYVYMLFAFIHILIQWYI